MATKKRLIMADVTVEAFTKWLTSRYDGRMPADIVNEIPTVDAVEVVHGKAVRIPAGFDSDDTLIRMDRLCSECGALITQMDNYCPNCGAKMDGEKCR